MRRFSAVNAEWKEGLTSAGLGDPASLLHTPPDASSAGGGWTALTKPGLGGRERWRWELKPDGARVLYVKRYLGATFREQVDRIVRQAARHSRAWWEYAQSAELQRQYVPAVRAVAVAEQMRGVIEQAGVVLFEKVEGEAFDRVWPQLAAGGAPVTRGPLRHDLTRRLARFISAFHQTGACHRDLYLCHVFAVLDRDAARPPRFALIDLARLHRPRWRRARWLIKDLAQLDSSARRIGATRADRLRFLIAYTGLQPGAPRLRWFARRIARKSNRILRRDARKAGRR